MLCRHSPKELETRFSRPSSGNGTGKIGRVRRLRKQVCVNTNPAGAEASRSSGFCQAGVHKVTLGVVVLGGRTRGPCCALKPVTPASHGRPFGVPELRAPGHVSVGSRSHRRPGSQPFPAAKSPGSVIWKSFIGQSVSSAPRDRRGRSLPPVTV